MHCAALVPKVLHRPEYQMESGIPTRLRPLHLLPHTPMQVVAGTVKRPGFGSEFLAEASTEIWPLHDFDSVCGTGNLEFGLPGLGE